MHKLTTFIRRLVAFGNRKLWRLLNKHRFKYLGSNSIINRPLKINGAQNISLQEKVTIEYKTWLAAVPLTGEKECLLYFGKGCTIGHFNHIYATKSIVFGENVLTADKVYISDNLHEYENIEIPIKDQQIRQNNDVYIGDGSWIGENVCILGAKVGKHCVIGANSVVTNDIPDFCIAVGAPAKIIKRYNLDTQIWERINPDGSFKNKK